MQIKQYDKKDDDKFFLLLFRYNDNEFVGKISEI